ncbi:sulfatase [Draconibacterium sp.]|nr:sulfatase [Draconibacterium sp.]
MIKRFTRIATTVVLFGFLWSCNSKENKSNTYEQLNVLLITADDLNYNSVGVYGCTIPNITPNIDKLAGQGMMFTNGFVNIAVCQPSRQSIMTGRYPHRNGAMGFEPIDNDVPTLQEELNKVGYLNGVIGKEEHMKPMDKFCWDFCIREEDVASGMGIGRDPELYYKYTAEFLAKSKKENKPFFLNANTHDPHRPFAGSDSEKKNWGKDLPKFSRQILPEEVEVPKFLADLPEVRKEIAEYYTSVYRCDEVVGAILKALEESGMADNTLVMFLSDNGIAVPFAKSNCYLNSNKTPWIIRWPGQVPAGIVESTHFISGIDYMPTILHALHLSKVPDMDGYSFLPVLQGKQQEKRNVVFTQFHKIFSGREFPMRGVKGKRYGYIVNFWSDGKFEIKGDALGGRTYSAMVEAAKIDSTLAKRMDLYIYRVEEELYDFKNDPDALVNLINEPDLTDEKMHLKKLLHREMKRSKDPLTEEFEQLFMNL